MLIIRSFIIALRFLTCLPVPQKLGRSALNKESGYSVLCYPIIGLVIGTLLIGLYAIFPPRHHTELIAALLLAVWNILTGGLHIDGLGDCADAWIGGHHNRERTLEIMKDAYCGPIGVMMIISVLIIKFAALKTLIAQHTLIIPLIFTLILSRTAIIALFLTTNYKLPDELCAILKQNLPKRTAVIVIIAVISILILFTNKLGIKILFITVISGYGLRFFMQKRLNGMTGDTAGAFIELLEALILSSFALA